MTFLRCDFDSEVLGETVSLTVTLPRGSKWGEPRMRPDPDGRFPVVYLLHGLSDDQTAWSRLTSIERYATAAGLAVVMPSGGRSFYADMMRGPRFWTFVSSEVPALVTSLFPISNRRDYTFAAGNSMGGYGAFKLALTYPDRFAAAASLSGVLDLARHVDERDPLFVADFDLIFGRDDAVSGTDNDLLTLASRVSAGSGLKPALYQWCGTEDFLHPDNVRFRDHVRSLDLDFTCEEGPGGHDWDLWDAMIKRAIAWLPAPGE